MTVTHGGLDEAELLSLGIDPDAVLDLSANLHPAGPSPAVLAAVARARVDRYAPADAAPLRAVIAAHERVPPDQVLPTAGATAAIHLIARAYVDRGDAVAIIGPTFGEYEAAVRMAGGMPLVAGAMPPDFAPPAPMTAPLGFLANPNNPTGAMLTREAVEATAVRLDGLLVVDAAYEAFVRDGWDAVELVRAGDDSRGSIAVVRSMTKLHAIPGIRLGYVVASAQVIERLAGLQHSWSLDAIAQAVGPVALAEHRDRVALLRELWEDRDAMRRALQAAGFSVGPSQANFLLIEVGDAPTARRRLIACGVLVRDCTSFGLPGWIRVAVPARAHVAAVTEALVALRAPEATVDPGSAAS